MRLWLLALASCVFNTSGSLSIGPAPTQQAAGGGTESCAEIVLNCDAQCHDPFCLRNCTGQGSPVGAQQHTALLDCGQSYGCMDEACMRTNCPSEVGTCEASAEPPQQSGY